MNPYLQPPQPPQPTLQQYIIDFYKDKCPKEVILFYIEQMEENIDKYPLIDLDFQVNVCVNNIDNYISSQSKITEEQKYFIDSLLSKLVGKFGRQRRRSRRKFS